MADYLDIVSVLKERLIVNHSLEFDADFIVRTSYNRVAITSLRFLYRVAI